MALWATWKSKQVQVLCLCSVRRIWILLSTNMRPVWWVSWICKTCQNILNRFCSRSSKQIRFDVCIHFNLSWNRGRLKFSPFMFCPLVSLFMVLLRLLLWGRQCTACRVSEGLQCPEGQLSICSFHWCGNRPEIRRRWRVCMTQSMKETTIWETEWLLWSVFICCQK